MGRSRASTKKTDAGKDSPAERTRLFKRLTDWKAWRKAIVRAFILVCLLPPALTILYAVVPPVSTLMLGRYVQLLWVDRQWKPLEEISPDLVRSVITSEDSKFCEHDGVDWEALGTQIEILSDGETPRGASTLTMQTAKNLFLWNDRSFVRKGLELPLALMLDAMLTKRRIMEIYLNVAEWGEGIFGAEAAAHAWFGVPASELTRTQAARLATALPNPLERNPAKPSGGHRKLSATNLSRVRGAGDIFGCVLGP